ncbi:U-box domain-containing protein [Legionella bononiensis]|uniref:U-box domain-containing protein n=1 Tax=Legionella bononiensis TaxID=2793102 RepID=A0ABS1W9Q4_9GAMM|nr:U-box domain-containing protein [Legionella bononiensis]MBL7480714.1 hypothetical protein [Legionella bononiensis]MBL7526087.1 hypothetical protein [Legionella bononiensis]MBL7563418.1 hypothetical protein [Legionella bononiensis]
MMGGILGFHTKKSEWDLLQDQLKQQQQTLDAQKITVFNNLNSGIPLAVVDALKNSPLLALVKDDTYNSSVLMAAVFNLSRQIDVNKRLEYIDLINYIIDHTKFDIRASNDNGSTVLHQIFWYAIIIPNNDPVFREQLTKIGIKLINHVSGSSEFLAIMSQQNNIGETILDNLDIDPRKIPEVWQKENMKAVQEVVYPELQKHAVKDIKKAETQYNFSTQTFEGHLEEILKDPIMLDIIENPVLLTTSGHSMSKESWDSIVNSKPGANTYQNPLTKAPTRKDQVYPNKNLAEIIDIYNANKDKGSDILFAALDKHLAKYQGLAKALVYNDLTIRGVIDVVSQYKLRKEHGLAQKQDDVQEKQKQLAEQQKQQKEMLQKQQEEAEKQKQLAEQQKQQKEMVQKQKEETEKQKKLIEQQKKVPQQTQIKEMVLADPKGNNFITKIEEHNGGYKIHGKNTTGESRYLIIDHEGKAIGHKGTELSHVEVQMFKNAEAIFKHFNVVMKQEIKSKLDSQLKTYLENESYLAFVQIKLNKIDAIHTELGKKIGTVNQHHFPEASDAAKALLKDIADAKKNYADKVLVIPAPSKENQELAGSEFYKACEEAINKAKPVLARDLNWGDYLVDLLKAIANTVVWAATLGNVNTFFPYKKPESMDVVEKAEQDLKHNKI